MKQLLKWQNGVSQQMSRVCFIHISQFGTSHETHSVTDMYIKITKQASEHSRAINMAWFTWKMFIEDGMSRRAERKIHCILIASPHVIVFALCFCIFANSLLRMNNISSCVEDCSAALELQPSYSKALHRWRFPTAMQYENHIGGDEKFWMWRYANHICGDMK